MNKLNKIIEETKEGIHVFMGAYNFNALNRHLADLQVYLNHASPIDKSVLNGFFDMINKDLKLIGEYWYDKE